MRLITLVLLNCGRLFVVAKTIKLSQLGDELKKLIEISKEETIKASEIAVRVVFIKTLTKIIKMTPVGNPDLWVYNHPTRGFIDYVGYFGKPDYVGGRARSNWFLGDKLTDKITDSTENKGATYLNTAMPDELMGNKTYFYNNLPYIERLEFGHSTQAPKGMVRISLLGWSSSLQRAFNKAIKAG